MVMYLTSLAAGQQAIVTTSYAGDAVRVADRTGRRTFLGSFGPIQTTVERGDELAVADLDGDGLDEIVVGRFYAQWPFRLGTATIVVLNPFGVQLDSFTVPLGEKSTYLRDTVLAAGDLDGDGDDELAIAFDTFAGPGTGIVRVLDGDGTVLTTMTATLTPAVDFEAGDGFAVGDVDGDGVAELVFAHDSGGTTPSGVSNGIVRMVDMGGALLGSFSGVPFEQQDGFAVGDVTGDAVDDIVIVHDLGPGGALGPGTDASLHIYDAAGTGTSPFFGVTGGPVFDGGDRVAVGDVNGDGSGEIIIAHDGGSPGIPPSPDSLQVLTDQGVSIGGFPYGSFVFEPGDALAVGLDIGDADGDGLLDNWEVLGMDHNGDGVVDLDLPALGVSPLHKDLLVEVDYHDCNVGGGDCAPGDFHSHRPSALAIQRAVAAFAAAPVPNPDGVAGIRLLVQVDEPLPHLNFCDLGCLGSLKNASFMSPAERGRLDAPSVRAAKELVFRYCLWTDASGTTGVAELYGDDSVVSLGAGNGNVVAQAGTFMHEFGHNLGLHHGGGEAVNCKPNYLSVMSYTFQTSGLPPLGIVDYSRQVLPPATGGVLDENNLSEFVGIQAGLSQTVYGPSSAVGPMFGTQAIDWDLDGNTSGTGVIADINSLAAISGCPPSPGQKLGGFDDWNNIVYGFRITGGVGGGGQSIMSDELTIEDAELLAQQLPPIETVSSWQQPLGDDGDGFDLVSNLDFETREDPLLTGVVDFDDIAVGTLGGSMLTVTVELEHPEATATEVALTVTGTAEVVEETPAATGCLAGFEGRSLMMTPGQLTLDLSGFQSWGARVVAVSAELRNCGGQATFEIVESASPSTTLSKPVEGGRGRLHWPGDDIVEARFVGEELVVDEIWIAVTWEDVQAAKLRSVAADDFEASGAPVGAVRFWGSYLDERYVPGATAGPSGAPRRIDGWVIAFHADETAHSLGATAFHRPGALLGVYFFPADAVATERTPVSGCEPEQHDVYEYLANLEDACMLGLGQRDLRDDPLARPPAQPGAFLPKSGLRYWLSVQALVGVELDVTTCGASLTGQAADAPFWGWHTVPDKRGAESMGGKVDPPSIDDLSQWSFGAWSVTGATPCPKGGQAFELLGPRFAAASAAGGSSVPLGWIIAVIMLMLGLVIMAQWGES